MYILQYTYTVVYSYAVHEEIYVFLFLDRLLSCGSVQNLATPWPVLVFHIPESQHATRYHIVGLGTYSDYTANYSIDVCL